MEADHCRCGIAGKTEDDFVDIVSGVVFDRDGGEGGGFSGFHINAAKMDCSAERALDSRFEEV